MSVSQILALEGMLPVLMREIDGANGTEVCELRTGTAELEQESPFPSTRTVTTPTDPVVKVGWGPEEHVFASGEAMMILKNLRTKKNKPKVKNETRRNRKNKKQLLFDKSNDSGLRALFSDKLLVNQQKVEFVQEEICSQRGSESGTEQFTDADDELLTMKQRETPMPPPGTPHPELKHLAESLRDKDILRHSLSTPTLPAFHSVSDAGLVSEYMAERRKDPAAFDAKTTEIKKSMTVAKVCRGGSNFLVQGDYTVELASREDAAMSERWQTGERALENASEEKEQVEADRKSGTEKKLEAKQTQCRSKHLKADEAGSQSIPTDFDLSENICKYTTSGSMRQQSTRRVEDDEAGRKTTYTTWIEIKQQVFVPSEQGAEWKDVLHAMKQEKQRKRAEKVKEGAEKSEGDMNKRKKRKNQNNGAGNSDACRATTSSASSSEDHDAWCPRRHFQTERRRTERLRRQRKRSGRKMTSMS